MISRHWRGIAKCAEAEAYVEHLRGETLPALRAIDGFVDASILRRTVADGIEFLVVTHWRSLEAVEAFAGREIAVAVVPAAVRAMMLEYDREVRHYEVVDETR